MEVEGKMIVAEKFRFIRNLDSRYRPSGDLICKFGKNGKEVRIQLRLNKPRSLKVKEAPNMNVVLE